MMNDEQDILRKTLSEWRIPKEYKQYVEKKAEKVVYAYEAKQLLPKGVKSAVMKRRKCTMFA